MIAKLGDVLRVLALRDFRLLWLAQTASTIGDRIVFVALALYVDQIGTPSDVGLVLAAKTLPLVALLLLGGVWADRLPRHRVMVASDLVRAALHTLLAALILLEAAEVWHVVVIQAFFGAAEAFFRPAYTGLVPQTVTEDRLQEANALNGLVFNVAEFIGPALATALVLGLGAGGAFAIDAGTFLVSAALLLQVRPRARGPQVPREPLRAELAAGWREVRSRAWLWVTIAVTAVSLLAAFAPYLTLGPSVSQEVYGTRAVYGVLLAVSGGGLVVGALLGLRWRPRYPLRAALAGVLPWPVSITLFALGLPLSLVAVSWAVAGVGLALFIVWWETALAERVPAHLLSRVSAFDWMGSLALLPLGYLLAGPLAEACGAVEVLVAGGLVGLLAHAVGLVVPETWNLERLQNSARPSSGVEASA